MEYNDDLAQRRMDAVLKLMANDRWDVSGAVKKIYSERKAGEDHYPLSLGRAKLITEFLMKQGVVAKRLTYQGHSNYQPKVWPETTDEERKQNRRVTVDFKKVR